MRLQKAVNDQSGSNTHRLTRDLFGDNTHSIHAPREKIAASVWKTMRANEEWEDEEIFSGAVWRALNNLGVEVYEDTGTIVPPA